MLEGDQTTQILQLFSNEEAPLSYGELSKEEDASVVTFLVGQLLGAEMFEMVGFGKYTGLLTGLDVALFIWYVCSAYYSDIYSTGNNDTDTFYAVTSIFALLSLHICVYGFNIWMWKYTTINYISIFKLNREKCLRHMDAFFSGTLFFLPLLIGMLLHLFFIFHGYSAYAVDVVPTFLVVIFIYVNLLPHPYRRTRNHLIQVLRNIVCSPYYKVRMVGTFMENQLTNQISLLRHVAMDGCYFSGTGIFKARQFGFCNSGNFKQFAYGMSFAPYFWRVMQVANVVLQVTWIEAVLRFDMDKYHTLLVEWILASCEIIRWGIWNFYRLENEALRTSMK